MIGSRCRVLPVLLSWLLAASGLGWAQQPQALKILVVAGEGAVNDVEKRIVTVPVIEVHDDQDRPVAGARVTFRAPASGPGVTFFGASQTSTVGTDEQGRARGEGILPNTLEGSFLIEVTATHGGQQATAAITQTNAVASAALKEKKSLPWRWLAAVGAVVLAVVLVASRSDDNGAAPSSATPLRSASPEAALP